MEKRHLTRREWLKLTGAGLGMLALGSTGFVGWETLSLANQVDLQNHADRLLRQYPMLTPYSLRTATITTLEQGNLTIAVRQSRAAEAGSLGMRLCDGAVPGVSLVDEDGISVFSPEGLRDESLPEARSLTGFDSPQALLVPITGRKKIVVEGRPQERVMIAGDSWTKWGGVEYSVPAMLQRLLAFSGYDTKVTDISSSGINAANHMAVLAAHASHNRPMPDTIITTLHRTDYNEDMQRLLLPAEEQKRRLGTAIYRAGSDFDPLKASVFMDARLIETVFPFIGRLREARRAAKGGNARFITDSQGMITDAGLLSPLSQGGKQFFNRYLDVLRSFAKSESDKAHLMMVLPDGLTDEEYPQFEESIITPVVGAVSSEASSVRAFANHAFPGNRYDAYDHPNPAGTLLLAGRIYQTLAGEKPSDDAWQKTWDHYQWATNSLAHFKSQLATAA